MAPTTAVLGRAVRCDTGAWAGGSAGAAAGGSSRLRGSGSHAPRGALNRSLVALSWLYNRWAGLRLALARASQPRRALARRARPRAGVARQVTVGAVALATCRVGAVRRRTCKDGLFVADACTACACGGGVLLPYPRKAQDTAAPRRVARAVRIGTSTRPVGLLGLEGDAALARLESSHITPGR